MSMHNSGRNDTKNPGGSVGFDRMPYQKTPANVPDSREPFDNRPEKTLGDYIARRYTHEAFDRIAEEVGLKRPNVKKLTFDEWWDTAKMTYDKVFTKEAREIWEAAQENV